MASARWSDVNEISSKGAMKMVESRLWPLLRCWTVLDDSVDTVQMIAVYLECGGKSEDSGPRC